MTEVWGRGGGGMGGGGMTEGWRWYGWVLEGPAGFMIHI